MNVKRDRAWSWRSRDTPGAAALISNVSDTARWIAAYRATESARDVLTEGLLMYLDDRDVAALSQAFTRPEIAWWIFDVWGAGLKK